MPSLNWKDLLQLHPEIERLGDGEQININHPNCPAGRDTKKRLYVKNKDGTLLGWCHHCRSGGGKGGGNRRHIRDRQSVVQTWDIKLPYDMTWEQNVGGLAWLNKYGITPVERKIYNIGWSDSLSRVILPVYDGESELVAWQQRRIMNHDTMPKYLTDKRKDVKFPMFLGTKLRDGDTVVLTEDILSAIVIGRQCAAISLLGTNLTERNRDRLLARAYSKVIVWLDDDNPDVKKAQRKIRRQLESFVDVEVITGHDVDPKEMTDEQIKTILQGSGIT